MCQAFFARHIAVYMTDKYVDLMVAPLQGEKLHKMRVLRNKTLESDNSVSANLNIYTTGQTL